MGCAAGKRHRNGSIHGQSEEGGNRAVRRSEPETFAGQSAVSGRCRAGAGRAHGGAGSHCRESGVRCLSGV